VDISYNVFRRPDYQRLIDGGLDGPSVYVAFPGTNAVRVIGCKFVNEADLRTYVTADELKRPCHIEYGDAADWSKVKHWTPCPTKDDHTWVCDPAWGRKQ
jgi:hypothetical protein